MGLGVMTYVPSIPPIRGMASACPTSSEAASSARYPGPVKVCRRTLAAACAVIGAVLLGGLVFRRPMLTWGATPEETTASLPGDELLPHADLVATRAITMTVPPRDVWPWLVQIGTGRAGAYSYDWLERVAGLDIHSSYRIVPQLQDLSIGDVIPVESDGTGLRVRLMEPDRLLGTCTDDGTWAWTWLLEPRGSGTRLLSRTRMSTRQRSPLGRLATNLLLVPASWVMERKMLLGLRQRAETGASMAP